ncbi:hypothetical protein F4811DRAFT_553187 [Daldinia bambusicola]|nr:hypothetical protein F4811DRAFT_553187 [Daldinia bambusicola]
MCTGTCWVYGCRRCGGTVHKDTSVAGHTCNAARRNRRRGCCRTGVEYTFYGKRSEELCALCEIVGEVEMFFAGEGMGMGAGGFVVVGGYEDEDEDKVERVGYEDEEERDDGGGASLSEGGEDGHGEEGGEEDGSGDNDDEEDPSAEDGGAKLGP